MRRTWRYVITIQDEDNKIHRHFADTQKDVQKFMSNVNYMDIYKVTVDCFFGIDHSYKEKK